LSQLKKEINSLPYPPNKISKTKRETKAYIKAIGL
jgi:hypothetical protein